MDVLKNYFGYNSKFKIDFSTYVQNYEPRLNHFLNKFVDNSEALFVDQEIESCQNQINEIKEAISGIEYHSEHREEYLQFFINRNVIPFNDDSEKKESDGFCIELSEEGKLKRYADELRLLFNQRIATNYKILEFLKNRKNKADQIKQEIKATDKQSDPLNLNDVALYLVYMGISVNKQNSDTLARKYGFKSGDRLYQNYLIWSKSSNRNNSPGTKIKLQNQIKKIEKVLKELPESKKEAAEEDLKCLRSGLKWL